MLPSVLSYSCWLLRQFGDIKKIQAFISCSSCTYILIVDNSVPNIFWSEQLQLIKNSNLSPPLRCGLCWGEAVGLFLNVPEYFAYADMIHPSHRSTNLYVLWGSDPIKYLETSRSLSLWRALSVSLWSLEQFKHVLSVFFLEAFCSRLPLC